MEALPTNQHPLPRIAILTANDQAWMMAAWAEAIPHLQKNFRVAGIWVFPNQLGNLKPGQVTAWYIRVFGWNNTLLLGGFAILAKIRNILRGQNSWEAVARSANAELHFGINPNRGEVIDWIKNNQIDIALTSVNFYLKEPLLNTVKVGFINKHAAVLPNSQGVFPYVWSILEKVALGVTYHKMVAEIDAGPHLIQWQVPELSPRPSMLRFYFEVFARFPEEIARAALLLHHGRFLPQVPDAGKGTYFSFPERKHIISLEKMGGRIAKGKDLFYILHKWLTRQ